jgi:hypothetical protein
VNRRGIRQGALLLATLLLACGASGCRRTPPTLHVESIRVADTMLEAAAESGVDGAAVESAARAALLEAGFRLEPGQPACRARVELVGLRLLTGEGGRGLRMEVRVELELASVDEKEPVRREAGRGSEPVGQGGPPAAARRALVAALSEAARGLHVGLSADAKPFEALLADLDSSDVRVRDHAVQALGERRDARALPGLSRRLNDGDRLVVDHAIGALTQLKDRRAVPALIELTRGTDAAIALRLIPVVADLGGPDAEGWLLTIEQAHPDPRVRSAATDSLGELRRAAGVAPK